MAYRDLLWRQVVVLSRLGSVLWRLHGVLWRLAVIRRTQPNITVNEVPCFNFSLHTYCVVD